MYTAKLIEKTMAKKPTFDVKVSVCVLLVFGNRIRKGN